MLSLSLRERFGTRFDQDPILIGPFSAISGILVVYVADNNGLPNSIINDVPWFLTVVVGLMDRSFSVEKLLPKKKSKLNFISSPLSRVASVLYMTMVH
jgi:hypothetical protein